ncbi:MAG: hypothetical protein QOD83_3269 [Solirubrobacteraceae bacterium]|jgi:hypothetical protein|nr:hypothetical protein [Solirubrobacteraceae bacterium]
MVGIEQLLPYLIASNLSRSAIPGIRDGLQALSACVLARWDAFSTEITGLGGLASVTYRLTINVNIRYGDATVFNHVFKTPESIRELVRVDQLNTFDPARRNDPHARLTGEQDLWSKLSTFPAGHGLVEPSLRDATAALVEQKLKLLQRASYARVAQRFARAGDPIQLAGQRLTGSKLLWQSFITAGLPLSIEANEILRTLVFGGGAILGGADADGEDSLLDDVRDIYALFSSRPEDPLSVNILGEIQSLNTDRVERLTSLLGDIIEAIQTTGQPEPPELFAPTLLRLGLVRT